MSPLDDDPLLTRPCPRSPCCRPARGAVSGGAQCAGSPACPRVARDSAGCSPAAGADRCGACNARLAHKCAGRLFWLSACGGGCGAARPGAALLLLGAWGLLHCPPRAAAERCGVMRTLCGRSSSRPAAMLSSISATAPPLRPPCDCCQAGRPAGSPPGGAAGTSSLPCCCREAANDEASRKREGTNAADCNSGRWGG